MFQDGIQESFKERTCTAERKTERQSLMSKMKETEDSTGKQKPKIILKYRYRL